MGEGPFRQFSGSLLEEDEDEEGAGGEGDSESVQGEERVPGDSPGHLVASASQPNLAEQANGGGRRRLMSPLTREALQHAAAAAGESSESGSSSDSDSEGGEASREGSPEVRLPGGYEPRGAWLRNRGSSGADAATSWGGASSVDASDMDAVAEAVSCAKHAGHWIATRNCQRTGLHAWLFHLCGCPCVVRRWRRLCASSAGLCLLLRCVTCPGASRAVPFFADVSPAHATHAQADSAAAGPGGKQRVGVHVVGRVTGFELVGERGSKVPNLSLAQGDVEGHVLVRFVFEYTK